MRDPKQERVINLPDEKEVERYAHGVRSMEFDANVAPYDVPHHATWWHLSKYINQAVINRLQLVGGDISIMAEAALVETGPMPRAEKKMYEHIAKLRQKFPGISTSGDNQDSQPSSSDRCFYTRLPGLVRQVGMSISELTALNLDKSEQLETVLKNLYGGEEDLLLGELQFAFIAFLLYVHLGNGFIEVLAAMQTPGETGQNWFQGTADAVRQFTWLFDDAKNKHVEHVLILSGDHLYRMDYMDFIQNVQCS